MTGNSALLDTNIVIEVFKENITIANAIHSLSSSYINITTLGELYIGINRVTNKPKHLKLLLDFMKYCKVLQMDEVTAAIYGELTAALLRKGKPIPTNDIWIAASAKQHGLILFTKDKHFQEIEGIDVRYW